MSAAGDDERPRPEGAGEALSGALEYASAGYLVGPVTIRLLPNGHKQAEFHTSWSAPDGLSCDDDQIKAWARQYPGTGFHAPCSPNGFVVAEGDVKRASEDGRVVSISGVQAWRRAGGPDSPMTVRTRSGGEHWYFAAPETPIYNSANAVEGVPNVDVRGEGGTVFIGGTHVLGPDGKSTGHYAALRVLPPAELPALPVTWARRLREASKSSKASEAGAGELPPGSRLWTPERVHDRAWIEGQVREACTRADELSVANFRHAFFSVAVTLYTAAGCGAIEAAEVDEMLEDAIHRVWNAPPDERDRAHVMAARRRAAVNPWRIGPSPPAGAADEGGDEDPFEDGGGGGGANEGEERERTSWWFADLDDLLGDEVAQEPPPVVLRRSDGSCLLYARRVNGVIGESESGKSWVAQYAVAQAIADGGHALYLDFEDSRAGVVGRMRMLGCGVEDIRARFAYIAPEEQLTIGSGTPAQQDWVEAVTARAWTIIVVDGLNVALDLLGLAMEDNREAGRGMTRFLRPMARETGAAVFYVDHVPKDPSGRGKGGIGAQAKRALTDGTALRAEIDTPFGRGQSGKLRLTVDKDRHGHVRGIADEAKFVGMFRLTSTNAHTGEVEAYIEGGPAPAAPEPTVIMERISKHMQARPERWFSLRELRAEVTGKNDKFPDALTALLLRGAVSAAKQGQAEKYRFARRFTRFIAGTQEAEDAMAGRDLEPTEEEG